MEYQNTPIGEIPNDWDLKEVQDIFEVKTGTTPSTKNPEYWENGSVIWITPADMSKMTGITISDSARKVTTKALKESNLNVIPKKSIILSTRAPVGYVALTSDDTTFNQGCKGIIPKDPDETNTLFYSYYLLSKNNRLQHLSGGSTFKELAKDTLMRINLPIPPIDEQKKIAEILSSTDQAIQKSDEIIGKTEQLKRGIIQKLLTEGIGHDEFNDSVIGRIPTDWGVERLGNITKVTVGHVGPISQYYTESNEGIPLVSTTNISDNGMDLKNLKFVSKEFDEKHKKSKVFFKDLIIARHGASGSASLVPAELNEAQSLNVVIVRTSHNFDSKYLEYLFNYGLVKTRLAGWKSGSVQGVVNTQVLEKFKIPIPTLPEQEKIVSIASSIDEKYQIELKRNERLKNIKKGLMNDLLTGRKRVQINN